MPHLGTFELIIILVIVLVLFGAGRISKIAGELGQGIRAFRKGLSDDHKPEPNVELKDDTATSEQSPKGPENKSR